MIAELKVKFRTPSPLSQDDGMKMWEHGSHFHSLPGRATYQLMSRGEADTLPDAVEGLCAQISEICGAAHRDWPGVKFVAISAEEG